MRVTGAGGRVGCGWGGVTRMAGVATSGCGTTLFLRRAAGAKTPWNLVKCTRGGGMSAAMRLRKSSGVSTRCVLPSGAGRFMR